MARITHFSVGVAVLRDALEPGISQDFPITITFNGDSWLRLNADEAVKLRNDLSRAITEAATAAAKAVPAEGEAA